MTKMTCVSTLALAAAVLVAAPAFAQFTPIVFNSQITLSCTGSDVTPGGREFFTREDTGTREWIARCNGLDPGDTDAVDQAVAAQTLVFDHVDHRLNVIDRCSRETVCSWHFAPNHDEACANVTRGTFLDGSERSVCAYPLSDLANAAGQSITNIHGTMYCNEYELFNHQFGTNQHFFNGSCSGYLGLFDELQGPHDFGDACQVTVHMGGEYVTPDSCDQ